MRLFLIQTAAFAYRNAIFAKRNVFVLVEMLFWPVIGVLSIGLMGGFLELSQNALAFVMTGAITAGILQVTQLDVGYSLLYDVWSKSLKHSFLAPIRITSAVLGAWIIGIVRGGIVFGVLVFLAKIFFTFKLPSFTAIFFFLLGVFLMSLLVGIAVWVLILLYGQRAEISVWALSYLVMVLCGIYYPVNKLPEPFLTFAKMLPLTYFLDAVRTEYGFTSLFHHALLKGIALSLAYTFAGIGCARLAMRHAHRTGLTVRISE